jgi:protein O-mannosyl-transferase
MLTPLRKIILALCALLLLVFAYTNHFHNPFEFDDAHTIETNMAIREIKNIPRFFVDATTTSSLPKSQAYRPGLTTLNAIDYYLGGKDYPDPFYYHLSIFISLIGLVICLFYFTIAIFKKYINGDALFLWSLACATLFGVHMANSQTINYIIARADSFSTWMVVIAFLMYIYSPFCKRYYLYLTPIFIGFSVKEPAIMFVPLLMVYQLLFENRTENNISTEHPFALKRVLQVGIKNSFPLILMAFMYLFSRQMTPKVWSSGNQEILPYLLSQPYVILHYFNNFFFPFNFVVDTDWDFVSRFTEDRVIIGLLFLILLLYIVFKTAKQHAAVAFGILWFLLSLLPTSSIFPLAEVLNDHRPFFGYIGLCIASIYGWFYVYQKYKTHTQLKWIISLVLPCIILLHVYGTRYHNRIWSSGEKLWKEATIHAPKNGRVWMNYGNTLMARGAYAGADSAFQQALKLWPDFAYISINLGVLNGAIKKDSLAEMYFKRAKVLEAGNPEVYVYYAKFLRDRNRNTEAAVVLKQGLSQSPAHTDLLSLSNEINQRIENPLQFQNDVLQKALEATLKNPTHEAYLNLSLEYYNVKRYEDCIQACYKALELKPDYALAYNNICSAHNELKQWDKAIEAGKKGLLIDPNNTLLNGNMNVALTNKKNIKK